MEGFLKNIAKQKLDPDDFDDVRERYSEDTNPDAINGDQWLENDTSFIWKVGVYVLIDANKCDWVHVFIGHKRDEKSDAEFIGHLYWQDGENDDIGSSLARYLKLLSKIHPVFEDR